MKSLPKGRARLAQSCLFDDPRRSLASGFLTLIKSGDPPARCGPAELSAPAERQAISDAQRIVLEASDIEQIRSDCGRSKSRRKCPGTALLDARWPYSREQQKKRPNMTRILSLAAIAGLLIASTPIAIAKGPGASFAPGQMMHRYGSVNGHPGASGYAPGHLKHRYGSVRRHPGYAHGHRLARR